jgi:hypothetical protein
MAISIDSVTFDYDDFVWVDKESYPDLIASATESLSGKEIVSEASRGSHYPITLEGTNDYGWLTGATVDALRALSRVVGATYTLTYGGETYTVRFRNEQSGGAIQMKTRIPTSNPGASTIYIGKIYLMCVG